MKNIFFALISISLLASCTKETACIGADCVLPEASVTIDSVSNQRIYVSLPNNQGGTYNCTLQLAADIDETAFFATATNLASPMPGTAPENTKPMSVYYISEDQSYVRENARYIHAEQATLEIIQFTAE